MNKPADKKQELISHLKKLQIELGRIPTHIEFTSSIKGGDFQLRKHFGNLNGLLQAAGVTRDSRDRMIDLEGHEKLMRRYQAICSKKELIQGMFKHTLDLESLFKRAGNPAVLKMTGQPDTHLKFADVAAYRAFKKFMAWYQPDVDLIFGDYLDCEGISHWPSDSMEPRRMVPEILAGRRDLSERNELTPKTSTRIFLCGNHEDWIRQAMSRMPEFFEGIDQLGYDFSVEGLLNLKGLGYEFFEVNHVVKIGKAHFTHGLYTPKNHAAKHVAEMKGNIYYGHLHDNQTHNETSLDGAMEGASNGCLCRLDAKFLRGKPNKWVQGFGVWEFFPDGSYTRVFIPIFNGRCSYAGIVFDGNT